VTEYDQSDYQALVKNLRSSLEITSVVGTVQAMLLQVVELKPGGGTEPGLIEMVVRIPEIPAPGEMKIVTKVAVFDRASKKLIGLKPT
jgi:hypothetical protein